MLVTGMGHAPGRWLRRWLAAWRLLPACLLPWTAALAAEGADLKEATARIGRAAVPWCGRLSTLQADGRRDCPLAVRRLDGATGPLAWSFLGGHVLTDELLVRLSPAELAWVLGHETAHHLLGHEIAAWRVAPMSEAQRVMGMTLLESRGPAPHDDAATTPHARELDADALGLLLVALAGYPLADALALWAPGTLPPPMAQGSASHPSASQRLTAARTWARRWCSAPGQNLADLALPARLLPLLGYQQDLLATTWQALARPQACVGLSARSSEPT